MVIPSALASAQVHLLRAMTAVMAAPRVGAAGRTRQLLTAMVGLFAIVAIPAMLVFYARRRWRP